MAKKYELITELYERTRQGVTEPAQWQRFLNTACRNYRLSFDEQLLLFAQQGGVLLQQGTDDLPEEVLQAVKDRLKD